MPARLRRLRPCLSPLLAVLLSAACKSAPSEPVPSGSGATSLAPAPSGAPSIAAPAPVEMPLDERRQIAGRISFVSERDGNREVYLIGADGSGEQRLTSNPAADYNGPASPDGAGLLLIRAEDEEGPQQLFFQPLDGGAPRPLSPITGRIRYPAFSPDGAWVVFESGGGKADPAGFADVHRVGADGKGAVRLTNNPEGNFEPAISPRGDAVVVVSSRDRVAELYRIRPDGSEPVRLTRTPRDEWGARFSPGGDELAFVSDRQGADRVYVMPANGGPARRVSSRDLSSRTVEDHPVWAPVGKKIAYTLSAASVQSRVLLVDLESARELEVPAPEGGGQMTSPVWSPDGRYLALTVTLGKDSQVYLVRADGSGLTRLTGAAGPNWNPEWVPARR